MVLEPEAQRPRLLELDRNARTLLARLAVPNRLGASPEAAALAQALARPPSSWATRDLEAAESWSKGKLARDRTRLAEQLDAAGLGDHLQYTRGQLGVRAVTTDVALVTVAASRGRWSDAAGVLRRTGVRPGRPVRLITQTPWPERTHATIEDLAQQAARQLALEEEGERTAAPAESPSSPPAGADDQPPPGPRPRPRPRTKRLLLLAAPAAIVATAAGVFLGTRGEREVPRAWQRQQQGSLGAPTFRDPYGPAQAGPRVAPFQWVEVACKVRAPSIKSASPDGYWYRLSSDPWDGAYYVVANTFWNGDVPGREPYTRNTDFAVPDCEPR